MAVVQGNTTNGTSNYGWISQSHDHDTPDNGALIVNLNFTGSTAPTYMHYGGVNLTVASSYINYGNRCSMVAYLVNPPTGSNTFSAGGVGDDMTVQIRSYGGILQSSTVGGTAAGYASSTSITKTATISSASSIVASSFCGYAWSSSNHPPTWNVVPSESSPTLTGTGYYATSISGLWRRSDFHSATTTGGASVTYSNPNISGSITMAMAEFKAAPETPAFAGGETVDNVKATSAEGHANITSDNGYAITERGWVVNTTGTPTTSDDKFTTAGTTGSYDTDITGRDPETLYYGRAFATNSQGTSYGDEVQFTTEEKAGGNALFFGTNQ